MATQVREQGRYLGGRPPYGYRLGDAGPQRPQLAHPNGQYQDGCYLIRVISGPLTRLPAASWLPAGRRPGRMAGALP